VEFILSDGRPPAARGLADSDEMVEGPVDVVDEPDEVVGKN
jgi:hypothetical protein